MSLGVLNNVSALYAENSLNQTQSSLQTTLQQLSSGQRINSGADDPAGLAVSDGLAANEAALSQSANNATDGVGLLQTADGALAQVTNLLDSAVSIATEAANGTLTSGQVSSANQEYQNILSEIGDIGSTTNFNSIGVFSSTAKTFFVSDGSSSGVVNYSDTVGSLTDTNVGTTAPSAATSTAITNPTPTSASTGSGGTATISLAASSDTISGTLSVAVGSGSAVSVNLGSTGVSLASAVSTLNSNSSFSGAHLVASQGTGSNANELIITGPAETVTTTPGTTSAVTNPTPVASTGTAGSTATFSLGSSSDTIGGSLSVAVGTGTASAFTITSGSSLASAVSQLNGNSAFSGADLVASQGTGANANKLIITGPADTGTAGTNTLVVSASDLSDTTPSTSVTSNTALSLTGTSLDDNVAAGTTPGAGVNFTSNSIATLTSSSAATVLTSVTTAIADVAYQRGTLGADINELTAASNVASTEQVNLASAQNSILATNYGQATSNLSKYQVLSQTGISALAQANSVAQEVLKLLQ